MRQVPEQYVLCLDIGNSHIFGGVYKQQQMCFAFRYELHGAGTSDQLGIFLRNVLRENSVDPSYVTQIAICSVVPHLDYTVRAACKKYFKLEPFVLQPGSKTGIHIKYTNPLEVGADVIAGSVAAVQRFPEQNLIIVDLGTATTVCPVSAKKEFLGGLIIPGLRLSMESLEYGTAKLPSVMILKPKRMLGRSTVESIQSGLYHGHLGAIRAMIDGLSAELFAGKAPVVIGTGGFAHLFAAEHVFTEIIPNIVLDGLMAILHLNAA